MRPETAVRILFLALFAITLVMMFMIFKPFLPGIAWATVLAVAFQPLYERLCRWLRGWKWTAAVLLSLLVAAFLVVPAALAVVKVGQGVAQAYTYLSERVASGETILDSISTFPVVSTVLDWVNQYVDLSSIDLKGMALSALKTIGNVLAGQTKALVTNAIQTVLTLAVMLVTMTVLFHEGPKLVEAVRRFLPLTEKDKEEVFNQMQSVTKAVFFGVLMTALVQSILGAIGFGILGVPAAVTLGAAMFFCALLPGGPIIVWAPVVIWLFFTGHPVKAVIMVLYGALVIGSMDNLIRPIFIGRGVRMHLMLVFFGILGGMMAFGLIGLFTGPLVITLFLFLMEVFRRDFFRDTLAAPTGNDPTASAPGGSP